MGYIIIDGDHFYVDKSDDNYKKNYQREYYKRNRFTILEKFRTKVYTRSKANSERIMCDCGGKYLKHNIKQHRSSKKHKRYIQELNEFNELDLEVDFN
jgi:hypothetical protein